LGVTRPFWTILDKLGSNLELFRELFWRNTEKKWIIFPKPEKKIGKIVPKRGEIKPTSFFLGVTRPIWPNLAKLGTNLARFRELFLRNPEDKTILFSKPDKKFREFVPKRAEIRPTSFFLGVTRPFWPNLAKLEPNLELYHELFLRNPEDKTILFPKIEEKSREFVRNRTEIWPASFFLGVREKDVGHG
jgi:hypothetical protein